MKSSYKFKKTNPENCRNVQRKRCRSHTPHLPTPPTRVLRRAGLPGGVTTDAGRPGLRRRGADSRAVSRAGQIARERDAGVPGLGSVGTEAAAGRRGNPGWRLRAGRPRPQPPWPPKESPREIPRRRSRAREGLRPRQRRHCRRPGLSWKALSSASRWRTFCEWPEAVRRRGRRVGPRAGGARRVRACGWVDTCAWFVGLAFNLCRGY